MHLGLAIHGPNPGPLHVDAPAAERHLTILVAMTDRGPVRVVPALRADNVVDLLFHQFGQNTEPDADAQREQPLLRCPDQLPQRFLDTLREHGFIAGRLSDRYVATSRRFLLRSWPIAGHAPKRSGRAGGTAVTSKFYEPRDNLGSGEASGRSYEVRDSSRGRTGRRRRGLMLRPDR